MNKNNTGNAHLEDWQRGYESKTNYQIRIDQMNKWLEKNNKSIIKEIVKGNETEDQQVGFVDL